MVINVTLDKKKGGSCTANTREVKNSAYLHVKLAVFFVLLRQILEGFC